MNEALQSAAGYLEPYGARIGLQPTTQALDPRPFLIGLLEQLATSCLASGASVIGHLKCLLRTPEGVLGCNLTSVRSGASCAARAGGEVPRALPPGMRATLDLTVLVYGLPANTIDALLHETLAALLDPLAVSWSAGGPCGGSDQTIGSSMAR